MLQANGLRADAREVLGAGAKPTFTLRVRYPSTGMIQDQEFPSANAAIRAAYGHFVAFPSGLAQILDSSGDLVHSHLELRELYQLHIK